MHFEMRKAPVLACVYCMFRGSVASVLEDLSFGHRVEHGGVLYMVF